MKTKLIHSGSSSSLAGLAPGVIVEEISTHPASAEFTFHPPSKHKIRKKSSESSESDDDSDCNGSDVNRDCNWLANKFRYAHWKKRLCLYSFRIPIHFCALSLRSAKICGITDLIYRALANRDFVFYRLSDAAILSASSLSSSGFPNTHSRSSLLIL